MKILFVAGCFLAMVTGGLAAPFSDLSFEAASKEAKQSGKIVLVDFYTTWCGPCKMLDKNTWTDAAVIALLEQKTVALRVDAEKETDLAKRYKIAAYPSVLLIKPDGTEIDRLVGYRDAKTFIGDFNSALAGKDSVARAREKAESAGNNDPSARMDVGRALAEKGKYAEALTEYLWCFDHGLEAGPGFYGVRLSFLLSDIKDLAASYPPAREALETRRDADQAKLTAGSTDFKVVQEVTALNSTLGQEDKNFAVFDQLPTESQGRKVIINMYAGQFLKAKRYADVLQGSDGISDFQKSVGQFEKQMMLMDKSNPMKKQMEDSLRRLEVRHGVNSFEALSGLKRNKEANELATQILKFDSSEATRTLLADAAERTKNTQLAQSLKK